MKIADLMTESPEFLTPSDTVFDAARLMAEDDVGLIPICESRDTRRLVGCVTDRDLVTRVIARSGDPQRVTCGEVMSLDLVTCSPEDDVCDAEDLMKEHQVRRVMVIDETASLRGIVATADLAREHETQHVGETVQSISQPAPAPAGV